MSKVSTTAAYAILDQLAQERRRALSDWRALILLRRATLTIASWQRRWEEMPLTVEDVHPILRRMRGRSEIKLIKGARHIYEVTVPYAQLAPLSEEEILMEAHPYAAISHFSALVFHGLTNELPNQIVALGPTTEIPGMYPPGTTPKDWTGLNLIQGRRIKHIMGRSVRWFDITPGKYFGVGQYQPYGYTILVTTPERTLLDSLQRPDLSGGLRNVLEAWSLARDTINLGEMIQLVDQFDIGLLRQRAGFLLEELGFTHPALDRWQADAGRGGSNKLLASAPYTPTFSERWNLSLNAPIDVLHG